MPTLPIPPHSPLPNRKVFPETVLVAGDKNQLELASLTKKTKHEKIIIRIHGFSQKPKVGISKGTQNQDLRSHAFIRQYLPPPLTSTLCLAFLISSIFFSLGRAAFHAISNPCRKVGASLLLNFYQLNFSDMLHLLGHLRI